MAVSYDPMCVANLESFHAKATAAKTTMTDSTNAVLLYTAPADGAEIPRLKARANGTNTASVLYLFTSSDAGTTLHLKAAVDAAAQTISTTAAPDEIDFGVTESAPMVLGGTVRLYCATSVALAAGWEFEGQAKEYTV